MATRETKETVSTFAYSFRDLLQKGYQTSDQKNIEPILINQFTSGLELD